MPARSTHDNARPVNPILKVTGRRAVWGTTITVNLRRHTRLHVEYTEVARACIPANTRFTRLCRPASDSGDSPSAIQFSIRQRAIQHHCQRLTQVRSPVKLPLVRDLLIHAQFFQLRLNYDATIPCSRIIFEIILMIRFCLVKFL